MLVVNLRPLARYPSIYMGEPDSRTSLTVATVSDWNLFQPSNPKWDSSWPAVPPILSSRVRKQEKAAAQSWTE